MYATLKDDLLGMFVDATAGESDVNNRLETVETESGNVALIGHGWLKIAEYNESRDAVTVFTGHKAINSKTTNRYLNETISIAKERGRDVVISGESPTTDTPPACVEYIGNYIGDFSDMSPVERDALDDVNEQMR